MIPEKIKLKILTPHKEVYSQEVSAVQLPGIGGYFGIHPGHTPFVSALKIGQIKVDVDGSTQQFATSGGVAEVLPEGVSVLAETCESAAEIDRQRAEAAKKRASERIQKGRKSWDMDRAQIALARAMNRLQILSK